MRLFIASDIHGSAFWCEKMLGAFEQSGAEKLVLLGDILYHGPRNDLPQEYDPKKVIAMLNPLKDKILCVRGNCDTEGDQMVLDFPVLADYCWIYADGCKMFLTHGHRFSPDQPPPPRVRIRQPSLLPWFERKQVALSGSSAYSPG